MACPFDPTPLTNLPLGMFHCPECGEMVLAGMAHPASEEALDAYFELSGVLADLEVTILPVNPTRFKIMAELIIDMMKQLGFRPPENASDPLNCGPEEHEQH